MVYFVKNNQIRHTQVQILHYYIVLVFELLTTFSVVKYSMQMRHLTCSSILNMRIYGFSFETIDPPLE